MWLNRRVPVGTHGGVREVGSLVKRAFYAILLGKKAKKTEYFIQMHIAAIYFIQRQIAAQNRYNKRSYKKQVFTWRTISFLHEHLLFYLLFTGGINSGSQVFITDPTINPTVIYNNLFCPYAAIVRGG